MGLRNVPNNDRENCGAFVENNPREEKILRGVRNHQRSIFKGRRSKQGTERKLDGTEPPLGDFAAVEMRDQTEKTAEHGGGGHRKPKVKEEKTVGIRS